MYKLFAILIIHLLFVNLYGQGNEKNGMGFLAGLGTQQKAPFDSRDYELNTHYFQFLFQKNLFSNERYNINFYLSPSYFIGNHRLLNEYFIVPEKYGSGYKEFREKMMLSKDLHEFSLQFGVEAHVKIYKKNSLFGFASVGPMHVDKETERLAQGFAFSDVLGIGLHVQLNSSLAIETRYSLRHESNANLKEPNSGHNTVNISLGILYY